MRTDLLDATASVNWARTNFPAFQSRINTWLSDNIKIAFRDGDASSPDDFAVMIKREPLPLSFNVEFGAYINAIRSSLDILANTLANRHGIMGKDVCFPVAKSLSDFNIGKYNGSKFINKLPASERKIIESLKPYSGGNDLLWELHRMDITRKHHRLLIARVEMSGMTFEPGIPHGTTEHRRDRLPPETDTETVLFSIKKGITKPRIKFIPKVFTAEPALGLATPATIMLERFADMTLYIIGKFR